MLPCLQPAPIVEFDRSVIPVFIWNMVDPLPLTPYDKITFAIALWVTYLRTLL